jgi:hypothetical protein
MKATRAEREKTTAASVLAHPVRVRVLEILNERDMSPVEFCREGFAPANMDVSHVAYHFRELAEYGCLTVIEENKRRGSIEHVYRGVGRAYFSDSEWADVSPEDKARITKTVFQGLLARVESAVMTETFDRRADRHMSWIAMKLDAHGWREMATTLGAAFSEVEQIRGDAEARLARSGEKPIPATCAILGFESPSAPDRPPPPSD